MSSEEFIRQNDNIRRDSRGYIRQTDSLKNNGVGVTGKPKEYVSRSYSRGITRSQVTGKSKKASEKTTDNTEKTEGTLKEIFKNSGEDAKKSAKLKGSTVMQEPRVISQLDEWRDWNTTPRTEDEIREMCLTNFDFVCFTYICGYSQLSADFIEELMVLSTGLLTKDNYDEYYETVKDALMIQMGIEEGEIDFSKLPIKYNSDNRKKSDTCLLLSERLDWGYIKSIQKDLPTWFRLKYHKQLNNKTSDATKPLKD